MLLLSLNEISPQILWFNVFFDLGEKLKNDILKVSGLECYQCKIWKVSFICILLLTGQLCSVRWPRDVKYPYLVASPSLKAVLLKLRVYIHHIKILFKCKLCHLLTNCRPGIHCFVRYFMLCLNAE